jgi:hypothetical protein
MQAKEPKIHQLTARKGFTLNGKNYAKGEGFKALIVNCFVHESIEMAALQIGDAKPNAVPWEFIAFKE